MIRECPQRRTETSDLHNASAVRLVCALDLALAEAAGGNADGEMVQICGECWAGEGEGEAGGGWRGEWLVM